MNGQSTSRLWWRTPLLVGAVTFLVFLPAVRFGFINWDDPYLFLSNPFYRGFHWANVRWMLTSMDRGVYIPLTWISHAIDYQLYAMNPQGHHFTSILFHAFNAVLFALVLRKMVKNNWALVVAVLFWSLHPLRVEPVVWVTERREVLAGFFFLLTLWMYSENRLRWAVVFYAGCLLSKATSVTLPVVLIVLEWPSVRWREKIPFFLVAAPVGLLTLYGQKSQGYSVSWMVCGWADRAVLSLTNFFFYFQKTVCPLGLSPYYEVLRPIQMARWPYNVHLAGSLLLSAFCWTQRAARPWLWKGWVSFIILLAPLSGLFQNGGQMAADRFSYLPGLVLSAGVGLLLNDGVFSRPRKIGCAAALLLLVSITCTQIRVWSNYENFVRRILAVDPGSSMGNNNWGVLLASRGRVAEALPYFERAVRRDPGNDSARINRDRALKATTLRLKKDRHAAS